MVLRLRTLLAKAGATVDLPIRVGWGVVMEHKPLRR
jgi:hypothetical protein